MKTHISIQNFSPAYAPKCIEIFNLNKKNMSDLYTQESLVQANSYNKYWLAFTKKKQVCGIVGFSDLHNGIGMMISLSVHPKFQRQKIGITLVEEVKSYARKNGFSKVLLLTHVKNKPMMLLAIKTDFIPEGSLRRHFRTGEDVIYFSYFID
jgi:ribosomal protein S18 acetylase RimI-like enzyme